MAETEPNEKFKKGVVLDHHQNVVAQPPESPSDSNLPLAVQALIDTRLNSAKDDLREFNRRDLDDIKRLVVRNWRIAAGAGWLVAMFLGVIGYLEIPKWIRSHVQQKMTEEGVRKALTETLQPLETKARALDERIQRFSAEINGQQQQLRKAQTDLATKQEQLSVAQAHLAEVVEVQRMAVAVKTGSLDDWDRLVSFAKEDSPRGVLSQVAVKEIGYYFNAKRATPVYEILVESVSLKNPGYTTEEMVNALRSPHSGLREAAANELAKRRIKPTVQVLCEAIAAETNSLVVAAITMALESTTGERFWPLSKHFAIEWWTAHRHDSSYKSYFEPYIRAARLLDRTEMKRSEMEQAVSDLTTFLGADANALHARSIRAQFFLYLSRIQECKADLDEVERLDRDYYYQFFPKALLHFHEKKVDLSVESLNTFLRKAPSFEGKVKQTILLAPLIDNPKIEWPSARGSDSK